VIRYSLHCDKAHEFDGWFASSADFDRQADAGFVSCPICSSLSVSKMLMAPSVSTSRRKEETTALALDVTRKEMMQKLRDIVTEVRNNAEDVGERFPEEARKIHYGETEARGIIGQASPVEVKALLEEGVEIAPLPVLPDDAN
jgi:hypothetical protein